MFKLAVITDEVSQSIAEAVQFAHSFELQGIELRSINEHNPFQWDAHDIRQIRDVARNSGLAIAGFGLPLFKCALYDLETRAAHVEAFKRLAPLAAELGVKTVRGFAFLRGSEALPLQRIIDAYQPILPLLADNDLTLALEPEPAVNTYTAHQLRALVEAFNSPRIRVLWDAANLLYAPESETIASAYGLLCQYICHVHIKDAVRAAQSADARPIGQGESDIPAQLNWLERDGYAAWLSLETHYRNKALSEQLLRAPSGSQFSAGGLEASTESMANLKRMLAATFH